jgi:trehalose synthase
MALHDVTVSQLAPERFGEVLTSEGMDEFRHTLARGHELLGDHAFWNVNSTARGGGVAEMLRSLIGYVQGAGIDARWVVVDGEPDFFDLTKRLHNRLHGYAGDGGPLGDAERRVYERITATAAEELAARVSPGDVVLLHDPQTAGMLPRLLKTGVPVLWRAHIGLDLPNDLAREAWAFLRPYVQEADALIFSRGAYAWEGLDADRVTVIPPSIDAFSPNNHGMAFTSITAVLRVAGLAADRHHHPRAVFERLDGSTGTVGRSATMIEETALKLDDPLVAQISRWDRLKDPLGILKAFAEHVDDADEPHLLLAGPDVRAVADDPEGATVLAECEDAWRALPPAVRRRVLLALLPLDDADENAVMVNALQRRADIVVQKSLAEGFGLTVAEAMWKGAAVIASSVGGIQDQIDDGKTGVLVDPLDLEAFGASVSELLADPHRAQRTGEAAQTEVRDHFLGARHLGQYVELLERVLGARALG